MSEYTTWHVYSLFFFTNNNRTPIFSSSPSNEISVISVIILWPCRPKEATASSFMRFLYHTQRRATVGRPPLGEWSARRRDLYLTTHTTYKRKTSMPPVGFEPTISAGEQAQTYALDRAATGDRQFLWIPKWNLLVRRENLSICRKRENSAAWLFCLRIRYCYVLGSAEGCVVAEWESCRENTAELRRTSVVIVA